MMKLWSVVLVAMLAFAHADADARRLGGGKSTGQQSSNVTQRESAAPGAPAQNATNAAAVLPSHPMAAWAERHYLSRRPDLWRLIGIALLGGACGAGLLSVVGNQGFESLIPYLLLLATLLFACGSRLRRWLRHTAAFRLGGWSSLLLLLICVYGGFFAAGMGVILMAGLLLLGLQQMADNNAVKNLLGGVVNSVAVVVWSIQGLIDWSLVWQCFAGAVIGGVLGAKLARYLSVMWLQRLVMSVGFGLSGVFFFR